MNDFFLGHKITGEDVRLPAAAFLRHAVCLGNAGSGKTVTCKVLCEEFIRQGIPVIAIDPQGDIASLALLGEEAQATAHGTPAEVRTSFVEKAEVVVWTPGSALGVPLSVNPLAASRAAGEGMQEADLLRERGFAAEALADLAGFDLRSAEGRTVTTLFNLLIEHAAVTGRPLEGIAALVRLIESMPEELSNRVASVVNERILDEVARRTRMLGLGTQSLLLGGGIPLDIDLLLGRQPEAVAAVPGKTRLSVVYLNTLGTERERHFLVAQIAQALYRWMLQHPSPTPQVLFYIDEVAPYLPPVRKPVCKDALGMLFRQGRKYGVCCLAATQSPGDIDYKALGQISTWNLGRLVVRQDIKKIENHLRTMAPEVAEEIAGKMPALNPGKSILFSPDVFPTPIEMQTRWLVTRHQTLDEKGIAEATMPELRRRLEKAMVTEDVGEHDDTSVPGDDSLAGPAVGRAEMAVLAVVGTGEGTVGSCEIVVTRGGTGRLTALGGQSKVSKESIKVAWEAASQLQVELELPRNFARRYDVTVLDTRLAVKKDGPSAGLAYLAGIVAAFRGTPARLDLAMTGEITILGKVLAVGGIEEKVRAAYEAGYATVLVPAENKGDVAVLPSELRQAIEIVTVATVQEALPVIFAPARRQRLEPPRRPLPNTPSRPEEKTASPDQESPAAESSQTDELQGCEKSVLELLNRELTALSAAEISERLGKSATLVNKVIKNLSQQDQVKSAKRGRATVWWHIQHPLRPEYGLFGAVEAVKLMILEPEACKRAGSQLASTLLIFSREELVSHRLAYLPLYRVRVSAVVREGWIFKEDVEKPENLYISGTTGELMSVQNNAFVFTGEVPESPLDVVDLDNVATFETCAPGDLELDDSEMKGLVGEKTAETSVLRKFRCSIQATSLVFFPVWRFLIRDKQNGSERSLCLDGLMGKPIVLNQVKPSGRKKK